jgi:hypothetical protein
MLEDVDVEVLDVAGGITDRLLAHALGAGDPLGLAHAGILLPAGDVRGADDHDVGALEVLRRDGMRLPHERRHVGVDEREVACPDERAVTDHVPRRIAHGCPSS